MVSLLYRKKIIQIKFLSNKYLINFLISSYFSGWGSGNKEWSLELLEDEESECLAVGDDFVAVATSKRNLRIFMICGTQREVIALPGPVVAMNGLGNHLVIAYHAGIGKKLSFAQKSNVQ